MADLVPAEDIARIVGVERRHTTHVARAVSAEQRVYILHPYDCLSLYGADLRRCPWSLALDEGIDNAEWLEDVPVVVRVGAGRLIPVKVIRG